MTPDRCAEIHNACFTSPRPWSAGEFADLLASAACFLCDAPSGFALGRMAGPEAELLTVAVEPAEQGKGTGRALLQAFETTARRRGAEELFLEVAEDNHSAIRLYEACDYMRCGARKDYYESPTGPRVSALVFKKTLK